VLLNVCMGDRASLVRRRCGCGLDRDAGSLHVHDVRSFEKLTAGGVTWLDVDVIRVLEEAMPRRYGGGPADWQLVERLDGVGESGAVTLVVDPSVGPLDPDVVVEAFLGALGSRDGGERIMAMQWRDGRVLRVAREAPRRTVSGKVLHVFQEPGAD